MYTSVLNKKHDIKKALVDEYSRAMAKNETLTSAVDVSVFYCFVPWSCLMDLGIHFSNGMRYIIFIIRANSLP